MYEYVRTYVRAYTELTVVCMYILRTYVNTSTFSAPAAHLRRVDGGIERAPLARGPAVVEAVQESKAAVHPRHTHLR